MKIIEKIPIFQRSDLIFLKHSINKYKFNDQTFMELAAMELATNLLKHTEGGEIFILEEQTALFIAALDKGKGITNTDLAVSRGHSTAKNSLGLGLYQLSQKENFTFELFTLDQKNLHGTIALIYPKNIQDNVLFYTIPFINEDNNGDFFAQKGKFLLFGDASGHNAKAQKSAKKVIALFFSTLLSCIIIEDFFKMVHDTIKKEHLRSAVFSLIEIVKNHISVCGVGNIALWHCDLNENQMTILAKGIVGEKFDTIFHQTYTLDINEKLLLTTDGISKQQLKKLLTTEILKYSNLIIALGINYFCSDGHDDSSVLVISPKE